ncbi:MAG: hypothetical protein JWO32_2436 [Bacteroidetes bacterium]|nr:hypothetical protein [Bacteroidota bacterium]
MQFNMKNLILLKCLILFTLSAVSQQSALSPKIKKLKNDTIIWRPDSLLHKEDFKAKAKSKVGPLGYSAIGIFLYPTESGGELLFNVEALFVKSKSYITQFSEYVLRHEQIHFNICELYARILRQRISETNFKKVKDISNEIRKLYIKISDEHNKEQNAYDKDTNHGLNSAKQKDWEDDINNRIKALDKFSDISINIIKK